MNVKAELGARLGPAEGILLADVDVDPAAVRAVMVNEVVPADSAQDFYAGPGSAYGESAVSLFRAAGAPVSSMADIAALGVYVTNAVKTPKAESAVPRAEIERSLPWLAAELALFPDARVLMLMGDVARKAVNMIAKREGGRNGVPSGSTYKLRGGEIEWRGIRMMPSYIMTGANLAIEKSKAGMIAEDIAAMLGLIGA